MNLNPGPNLKKWNRNTANISKPCCVLLDWGRVSIYVGKYKERRLLKKSSPKKNKKKNIYILSSVKEKEQCRRINGQKKDPWDVRVISWIV